MKFVGHSLDENLDIFFIDDLPIFRAMPLLKYCQSQGVARAGV